uniref:Mos1 transposase HTH domain-containing protein n=1 Tax=Trichuris muris TaxID=70415 RepID=A0A5S6QNF3_TRIMR
MNKTVIRGVLLYEFKQGTKAAVAARKINMSFGSGTLGVGTARWWFRKFRSGNESLEDNDRSGRPSDLDEDQLRAIVEEDPRRSTSDIAEKLGVHKTTVSRHLQRIGKRKKLDQWIPHELTEIQKLRRFEISSMLLLRNKNDPFLARIVTCDEKWILYDNRRRSSQWLDKGAAPKRFPKPDVHQKKVMLTVWWSATGIIHYNILKAGETVTAQTYCSELEKMHEKLQRTRPALTNRKGPILLHDNARPHVSQMTVQKLHHLGYETLPHPPYSPDLSPTDYHIFKHLDHFLSGRQFKNQEEAKTAFEQFIASKTTDFYATGINALASRWQKCVDCDGSYFD